MTRDDLKNYRYSQKWITEQIEKYKEQKSLAMSITQNLDGMPKAQNKPNYRLEELMDKYDELLGLLIRDQEKQNQIVLQLREMEQPYRNILHDKYILGKSLETIASEMPRAYENVCRMHGTALNMFDELDNKLKSSVNIKTNQ